MNNNENVVPNPEESSVTETTTVTEEERKTPEEAQKELREIVESFGFDRIAAEDTLIDKIMEDKEETKSNVL